MQSFFASLSADLLPFHLVGTAVRMAGQISRCNSPLRGRQA
jgi:hypothetical protein